MTILNCASDTAMTDVEETNSNHVKVIVRVRPPNERELQGQRKNIVEIMNENILVFDPKESSPFPSRHGRRRHRDIRRKRQKDIKFGFDHVFGWTSSNVEVFEHTTKSVIDGLLGGYNCSVFAYGATGSGKTYTMLGSKSNPGVIYHTMIHLYNHIDAMSSDKTCDVAVSYLEVYNEQIRDLLLPRGSLPLREDRYAGVIVQGLSLHKPSSAEELLHMLQFGNQNRTQHPTDANAESSRSHAVFQVFVRQRDRTANISAQVQVAKMCLVDLAGSERATVTKNSGARFREGANINRSLLALGNVIKSLAEHQYKGHIPYRDSKLTRLLKDSLGGNCRTIMITAVSPSDLCYEDTYNTLKYADRAKSIRLNMKKNILSVDFHVSQYGKIVEELRKEITELKFKLQQHEGPSVSCAQPMCLPSSLHSLHEGLQAAYSEKRSLRQQQLRQEISLRNTKWRLYRKQKGLHRVSQLAHTQPENVEKMKRTIEGLQRKVVCQEAERQALSHHLNTNTCTLRTLQSQAAVADNKASLAQQLLDTSIQKMSLEVEVNDAHLYIHHLRRLARAQDQEAVASDTVITALLQLVQRQHWELQHRGPVSSDITSAYNAVCNMLGSWGVSWAQEDSTGGEGEDQANFNINSIINIPFLTTDSVVLPGHSTGGTMASSEGAQLKASSQVISCPGRVVNGQVVFSVPASVVNPRPTPGPVVISKLIPGPMVSSQLTPGPLMSSQCAPGPVMSSQPAPGPVVNSQPTLGPMVSSQLTPDLLSYAPPCGPLVMSRLQLVTPNSLPRSPLLVFQPSPSVAGRGGVAVPSLVQPETVPIDTSSHQLWSDRIQRPISPATTLYAGHTPNPQTLPHRADQSQGTCSSVSHTSSWTAPPVSSSWSAAAATALNETFSVEEGDVEQNTHSVLTSEPSHLRLPVIDNELLCGLNKNLACSKGGSVVQRDRSVVDSKQHKELSSSAKAMPVCFNQSLTVPGNRYWGACSSTAVARNKDGTQDQSSSSTVPAYSNDKNKVSQQKSHSTARRAINFDCVNSASSSSPMRVEGKSYADAVRTPTPSRQPLRTVNCNSPQVQSANLPANVQQLTPRSGGRSSVYNVGPQALDNMRRLRKMGMPSLVENLLVGHNAGSTEANKPSYRQPTKVQARRVLSQSKDDGYNPSRIPNKPLAHNRSKSTSHVNKVGWRI